MPERQEQGIYQHHCGFDKREVVLEMEAGRGRVWLNLMALFKGDRDYRHSP